MVCARVIGNDATVAWAGASGSFELNVAITVMGTALWSRSACSRTPCGCSPTRTIDGLEANRRPRRRPSRHVAVDRDAAEQGHRLEAAAKIAKHSVAKGITVREAVIDLGYVERGEITEEVLDAKLDLLSMTHPG